MPIRTDRGRAAVYRRFWGWPLRSPQRLALTTLAIAGAGVSIALLASLGAAPGPQPASEPASSAVPPKSALVRSAATTVGRPSTSPAPPRATTAPPSTATPDTPTPNRATVSPDAAQTARMFVTNWVTHPPGMSSQQWAAQLAPLVVPEYLATLESIDPTSIPATAITGDPVITATSPDVTEVTVPTNADGLHLILLAQPDHTWRVRSYDPAAR